MLNLTKTNFKNVDFQKLNLALDTELKIRDGVDHVYYSQFNKIDTIKYVLIAYDSNIPVACGALKEKENFVMEIKRMYVIPEKRGLGIASEILSNLELWAIELNSKKCILETGQKQPEAINLYKKNNYQIVPNFPPYENDANSICFEKFLK